MTFVKLEVRVEPVLAKPERTYTRENHRWTSTGTGKVSGTLMTYLKRKALERGIGFHLTSEQLWELYNQQKGLCALSGVPIILETKINSQNNIDRTNHTASLDRIDNSKPYTLDNVQWIHKVLNHMRRQYSVEEYVDWCEKVAAYQKWKQSITESKARIEKEYESNWGSDWVDDGV